MVYQGSKNRIAKEIVPIITANLQTNQWYVEPFVGGCNLIDKVQHPYKIGSDNNKYLIELLKYVQNGGTLPEYVDKEEYLKVKADKENYPEWYVGFLGFVCSFRGIFFSSYVRNDVLKKSGKIEHYQKEQINNLMKQAPKLEGIDFICSDYDKLVIPEKSVIYCDPPYKDTTGYKDSFDSERFWNWVRELKEKGNTVFVSEYSAPEDFECIWSKEINSNLGTKSKRAIEKLFV